MIEKYTVQTSMPSGKTHQQYGTEYVVKFVENEGTFKLWYKTQPEPGFVQEGTIDGWKFTKAKKEYTPPSGGAGSASAPAPYKKPAYKDNSDGMRQGMCINNAANFVNALAVPEMDAVAWATMVHTYANELYALGDLTGLPTITAEEIDHTAPAKKVFGV